MNKKADNSFRIDKQETYNEVEVNILQDIHAALMAERFTRMLA